MQIVAPIPKQTEMDIFLGSRGVLFLYIFFLLQVLIHFFFKKNDRVSFLIHRMQNAECRMQNAKYTECVHLDKTSKFIFQSLLITNLENLIFYFGVKHPILESSCIMSGN